MYALITGASSGIGYDIAKVLADKGYDLIVVARRKERLEKLKEEIKDHNVIVYPCDVSKKENCFKLYEDLKDYDINVFINNAGFGDLSSFVDAKLDKLISMIDTNITAATILYKLFLSDFYKKNKGYILNVASAASYTIGPLMATYYASKSYLYKLTIATNEELRRDKINVHVSVLCPGPVKTEFNDVANCSFAIKQQESSYVAKVAIKKLFRHKLIIIPSKMLIIGKFLTRFVSEKMLAKIGYKIQKKKK
ncbi:MAG: SDR family oxidoreductase [Erysipelotrichaceae bacterium]|nr:SDR family oxidoreductase [Erysipelotrichaceae bacterium]